LKGLGQLPDLPDLAQVMDDREQLKEFATRVGRDVSDEELEDFFTAPQTDVELEVEAEAEIGPADDAQPEVRPAAGDAESALDPDGSDPAAPLAEKSESAE